jgi:branched-subunit amino acid transport protein AzlD
MRLTLAQVCGLSAVAITLGVGQIFFKIAASRLVVNAGLAGLFLSFLSPYMFLALVVYAVATVAWVYLLHGVPLIAAYPFVALALSTVPLLSWYFLDE